MKFFKVCFTIIAIAVVALISGFTLQTLWSWFIVPTFSIQPLTIIQAVGISFFIKYLQMSLKDFKNSEPVSVSEKIKIFVMFVVIKVYVLALGWIITLFM